MAIIKRPTAAKKVVSRFDPSWRFTGDTKIDGEGAYVSYCNTLDFGIVEKCGTLQDPFTVIEILPLKVMYEPFVNGDRSNWWEIFRSHVTSIDEVRLEMKGDKISDSMREQLPKDLIEDIGRMIVDIASVDGVSVFFTLPDGYWEFSQNCHRLLASEAKKAHVPSVDVNHNP